MSSTPTSHHNSSCDSGITEKEKMSLSERKQHRPTMSAPPSLAGPFLPTIRRKRIWDKLATGHLRIVSILFLGLTVFFALHAAFGQLSRPRFQHLDTFPKKIWQSWKVDPLRFEDRDIRRARSWTGLNPSHRYEVLTDSNALPWVELNFGPSGFNRPDIITTYKALENNLKIIQADLLRYLIMYVEGGVWTDIDVQALKPIDTYIPKGFREQDINMIIGIETDEPDFKDHPVLGSKAQSFCQWTFVCKPRLPVMLQLIDNIQIWLAKLAHDQKKEISELHLGFDEVLSGTGPSAFTNAILKAMSKSTGRTVKWDTFHDMTDSLVVGGVLVLPSEAFAAGTGHSKSGNHGSRRALVKHHFHASSWTKRHPRHKHPIYGEVEKCNWNMECVKLWDANTAFYSSLPERDQQRMIGIKRLHEAQTEDHSGTSAQVPMAAPQPQMPAGPPDLAAIDAFLKGNAEPAKPDDKAPVDDTKEIALDLAAIDAYLKVTQPADAEKKVEDVIEEKQDLPIDLAAIDAFLHGTTKEEAAGEKKPEEAAEEKKDVPLDLAAIDAYLKGTTKEDVLEKAAAVLDEMKDAPPEAAAAVKEAESPKTEVMEEKEPPIDLAAIEAWLRATQQRDEPAAEKKVETASFEVRKEPEVPAGSMAAVELDAIAAAKEDTSADTEELDDMDAEDDFDEDWDDEPEDTSKVAASPFKKASGSEAAKKRLSSWRGLFASRSKSTS